MTYYVIHLGQVAFFPDRLKNRFDPQIEQSMEQSTTQPDNEKHYAFHLHLLALLFKVRTPSSPADIGGCPTGFIFILAHLLLTWFEHAAVRVQ